MSTDDDCTQCGQPILVMAFKGTGVCSELCRKKRDNDWLPTGMKNKKKKGKR